MLGAINAVAELSPAISWAHGADVLAFVYYEKGEHAIWKIPNPRSLKREPFKPGVPNALVNPVLSPASGANVQAVGRISGEVVDGD